MFVKKHSANFTLNNSRIFRIQNAKFSGYYFYTNANIMGDFQIYISVPLSKTINKLNGKLNDL